MLGSAISAAGSVAGSLIGSSNASKQAKNDRDFQKRFAKKGIQWRVRDAEAAGLHPLAALGASTLSPSPTSTASTGNRDYGIAQASQQIGRALAARQTQYQKDLAKTILQQEIAKAKGYDIDNQIRQHRLDELNNNKSGPGQADFFDTNVNPNSIFGTKDGSPTGTVTVPKQITAKRSPSRTAGSQAGLDTFGIEDGSVDALNERLAEATENDPIAKTRINAIRGREIANSIKAYAATNNRKLFGRTIPTGKWHTYEEKQRAKRQIQKLRRIRRGLPKYKYRHWKYDPKYGWRSYPNTTSEGYRKFFTGNTNPTPY